MSVSRSTAVALAAVPFEDGEPKVDEDSGKRMVMDATTKGGAEEFHWSARAGDSMLRTTQCAGERPRRIGPGMQLLLREFGSVVKVVAVEPHAVKISGAGCVEAAIYGIASDGTLPTARALELELAADWAPAWETATYYDCGEPRQLRHRSPEAAVRAWVMERLVGGCLVSRPDIAGLCPLEVTAFKRDEMSSAWLADEAQCAVENFEESYAAEFCHSDHTRPFDGCRQTLLARVRAVFAEAVDGQPPSNFTAVASRLYEVADVEYCLRGCEQPAGPSTATGGVCEQAQAQSGASTASA